MNFSKLKRRLFHGDAGNFYKGMATLLLGTGTAKLIGLASMPIISRIYAPEDFGVLTMFISFVAIFVPCVTLRYSLAIPLPRRDSMAINLLVFSCGIMLVMCSLIFLTLLLCGDKIFVKFSMQQFLPYWWLLMVGIVASSTYEILSMWATRKRAYKTIAETTALQGLLGNLTKLGLGFLALKPLGLLIGQVIIAGGGIINLCRNFLADFKSGHQHITLRRMRIVAGYYRDFPKYRLPSQFLLVFSLQAPAIFSAVLYDVGTTGQLGLALTALAVPVGLIGQAAGQAFYGEIAHLKKGSEVRIKELAVAVQKRLFLAGLPISLGVFFLGELIFKLVFGEQWGDAGLYASTLAPFVLLQLTSAPLIQILNVYKTQKVFLIINMFRSVGLLVIFWICNSFSLQALQFIQLLSSFLFTFYLFITLYILHLVHRAAKKNHAI